jgi:hypothetical protein
MQSFNEAYGLLMARCESSTSFMLVKAVAAAATALSALNTFDEIADYPPDVTLDADSRAKLVADLLGKAVKAAAQGESK